MRCSFNGRKHKMAPTQVREFFIFGSIVVYSRDRFLAREIYEEINRRGLATQPTGTMSLHHCIEVTWQNLSFEDNY